MFESRLAGRTGFRCDKRRRCGMIVAGWRFLPAFRLAANLDRKSGALLRIQLRQDGLDFILKIWAIQI